MSVISIAVGDALKSLKYWIDQDADEFSGKLYFISFHFWKSV